MIIDRVKTLILSALFRLMSWIPLRIVHALAELVGFFVYLLPTETRRVTQINLQLAFPQLTTGERNRLAKQSINETIKAGFELGHMWYGSLEHIESMICSVTGMEYVEDAKESGRGIIYAAPHIGSWELLGIYLSTLGPMTTLYKPPKIEGLDKLIADARAKAGAELVPTDRQGVVRLTRALQQGDSTGILPDQQPKRDGGVFAPFFGKQAFTMTLLPKLAAKTDSQVLFAYAKRRPKGQGFDVVFFPAEEEILDKDPAVAAAALNRGVEKCVLDAPSQYQWEYKRFRKRPEGETERIY
ncbi:MAG TPA: lysophospholipid acyltransferase family protein [Pseudohongiella sp.]|nr:lysophospholipid acyltransferase family protein [Pseudohongiella sp.]